MQLT
jgi:hypothetical protein